MPDPAHQTTIIGADTRIKGEMSFDGSARILGSFEGSITAKGELHVADGASCKATIEAGKVTVDGLIEGNVTAKDKIELTARARLKGDLISAKLLVAEGASFTGHVTVGPEYAKAGGAKHDPAMVESKPPQANRPMQQQQMAGAKS
jgi:cytoskeletal protein CcmA (bactofilin family)